MQPKKNIAKQQVSLSKPEDIAKKQLEIENLRKKINELNTILENFSKNNAVRKNENS